MEAGCGPADDGDWHLTAPIFILAGEPSGDRLAASLMKAVNGAWGAQHWIGVGGPAMTDEGLQSNIDMDALTVFGFGAALAAYPRLSRLADRLVDQVMAARPRAVITVDVKGFSLRFAARLKSRMAKAGWSAQVIHCVAPTVWAWGAWRRHRVARCVDGLLCLFPFEPDWFTPLGVKTHFIGHPEAFNPAYESAQRPDPRAPKHLVILPGSRRSEIRLILPTMLKGVASLQERIPDFTVSIPTLPRLVAEVETICRSTAVVDDISIDSEEGALFRSLSRGHAVLAASGTVTLQTALYGVPGVACYIAPALSAFIGRRLVRMDRVILPNALLGRDVYPFLFQEGATAAAMAATLGDVFADDGVEAQSAHDASELRAMLRGGAASFEDGVVAALTEWLGPPPSLQKC